MEKMTPMGNAQTESKLSISFSSRDKNLCHNSVLLFLYKAPYSKEKLAADFEDVSAFFACIGFNLENSVSE